MPPLSAPSRLTTSATTRADRLASSISGLMNITLPVNVRPGSASAANSIAWPTFTSARRVDGTDTVRSSTRLSTMRNSGVLPPMFSTRSPTLTPRNATTPSIGANSMRLGQPRLRRLDLRLRRRRGRLGRLDRALRVVEACGVIRPNSFSCCARSYSRFARDSADARLGLAGPQRRDAGLDLARVEPREAIALADGHPFGHEHVGDRRRDFGLHVGRELRRERADHLDAVLKRAEGDRRRRDGDRRLAGGRRSRRLPGLPGCPAALAGAGAAAATAAPTNRMERMRDDASHCVTSPYADGTVTRPSNSTFRIRRSPSVPTWLSSGSIWRSVAALENAHDGQRHVFRRRRRAIRRPAGRR